MGQSDSRSHTVCMCVGSLTGRGRSLLGADYSNELDNGAGVCVYIDLCSSVGIYNAVSKSA